MKKFAVIEMGPYYTPETHRAEFAFANMTVYIRTVRDFDEAKTMVDELVADGVTCIELCGAFGPDRARALIEQTGGKIAIGYGTCFPEQGAMLQSSFLGFRFLRSRADRTFGIRPKVPKGARGVAIPPGPPKR